MSDTDHTSLPGLALIPGASDYAATPDGRVFSRRNRYRRKGYVPTWRELAQWQSHFGYLLVGVTPDDGKRRNFAVHRLILLAFRGPCPPGYEACHNDGNQTNNRLDNLRWDTVSENRKDTVRHGKHYCHTRKLDTERAAEIKAYYATGARQVDVAARFGISQTHVSRIIRGEFWSSA